jgi:hypothetical protein
MKSPKMFLAAAAMTGLLAGAAVRASAATVPNGSTHSTLKKMTAESSKAGVRLAADKEKGKHDCKGKNECKGQGGCKSGDNGCKGKNSCKGHGGCKTNGEKKA